MLDSFGLVPSTGDGGSIYSQIHRWFFEMGLRRLIGAAVFPNGRNPGTAPIAFRPPASFARPPFLAQNPPFLSKPPHSPPWYGRGTKLADHSTGSRESLN